MKTLFILGRQSHLGLAELESVLGAEHIVPFSANYALSDIPSSNIPFNRLGGSKKLCEILGSSTASDWHSLEKEIIHHAESLTFGSSDGKITCGLSIYDFEVGAKDIMATGLRIKKALKKATGQSVRFVPNQNDLIALSSAQILHNGLAHQNGAELVLVSTANKTLICRTIAEQDIIAYSRRDQNRPKRDARVGMLPPKLAQIILNLGVGQAQPPLTVLDPFCGTGVVLQEAALLGYNLYGSDLEQRMVEYTAENLTWLNETHKLPPVEATLQTGDATTHKWDEKIDAVACEGYLGQPFTGFPSEPKLREVTHTCNQIAKGFLKNIATQIPSGTRLCIALPAWHKPNGTFIRLKLLDQLSDLGYNRVSFAHTSAEELLYYRPDQIVARDLLVITRK